jgi:hypothetical protein
MIYIFSIEGNTLRIWLKTEEYTLYVERYREHTYVSFERHLNQGLHYIDWDQN